MDQIKECDLLRQFGDNNINTSSVDISNSKQVIQNNFVQINLNNQPAVKLALPLLADKAMHVFRAFYASKDIMCISKVDEFLKYKVHVNYITRIMRKLELAGLITSEIRSGICLYGLKEHTLYDKRHKWFAITQRGVQEFENQLAIRPNMLPSLSDLEDK